MAEVHLSDTAWGLLRARHRSAQGGPKPPWGGFFTEAYLELEAGGLAANGQITPRGETALEEQYAARWNHIGDTSSSGRWSFIRHRSADGSTTWLWQRFGRDGKLQHTSGEHPTYGLALRNALDQGFVPTADDYSVDLPAGRLHFPPGRDPEFTSGPESIRSTHVRPVTDRPGEVKPSSDE